MLNGGIVSSKSKKQQTVALSTAEAEYVALSAAIQEAMWLRSLLQELGVPQNEATIVMQDNQSTMAIATNPEAHERTKHIDIRHHFVRDTIESGAIELQYCPTQDMIADIFTKALDKGRFEELRTKLGVINQGGDAVSEARLRRSALSKLAREPVVRQIPAMQFSRFQKDVLELRQTFDDCSIVRVTQCDSFVYIACSQSL